MARTKQTARKFHFILAFSLFIMVVVVVDRVDAFCSPDRDATDRTFLSPHFKYYSLLQDMV